MRVRSQKLIHWIEKHTKKRSLLKSFLKGPASNQEFLKCADHKLGIPEMCHHKSGIPEMCYHKSRIPEMCYNKLGIPKTCLHNLGIPEESYHKSRISKMGQSKWRSIETESTKSTTTQSTISRFFLNKSFETYKRPIWGSGSPYE